MEHVTAGEREPCRLHSQDLATERPARAKLLEVVKKLLNCEIKALEFNLSREDVYIVVGSENLPSHWTMTGVEPAACTH